MSAQFIDVGEIFRVTISATAVGTGSFARKVGKRLSATSTGTASLRKLARHTIAATATGTASFVKKVRVTIAATAEGLASIVGRLIEYTGFVPSLRFFRIPAQLREALFGAERRAYSIEAHNRAFEIAAQHRVYKVREFEHMAERMPQKRVSERLDYDFKFKNLLEGDTITGTPTITVEAGITLDGTSNTTDTVKVWLTGGTVGTDYTITCEVQTAGERTLTRSIVVPVIANTE
jgi:hypothetical protein